MTDRTIQDESKIVLLVGDSGAHYTQVFTEVFADAERVTLLLIGHASVNVSFEATIATDSSGTSPTDVGTAITVNVDEKFHTMEFDSSILSEAKRFFSAKVTFTAGAYTLMRIKRGLRDKGSITQDSTWVTQQSNLG